jgi:hypothetical protein
MCHHTQLRCPVPALPSCILEPLWDQVAALLPTRQDTHRAATASVSPTGSSSTSSSRGVPAPIQVCRLSVLDGWRQGRTGRRRTTARTWPVAGCGTVEGDHGSDQMLVLHGQDHEPADELLPVAGSGVVQGSTRQPRDRQGSGDVGRGRRSPGWLGAGRRRPGRVQRRGRFDGRAFGRDGGRARAALRAGAPGPAQPCRTTGAATRPAAVSVAAGAVGLVACPGSLPAAWVGRDTAGFTAGKAR